MRKLLHTTAILCSWATVSAAQEAAVRLGTHNGYGRVVFDLPAEVAFTSERAGSVVTLHFPGAGEMPSASGAVHNVVSVQGATDTATVTVAPGARLRTMRIGNRIILDVLDGAPAKRTGSQLVNAMPRQGGATSARATASQPTLPAVATVSPTAEATVPPPPAADAPPASPAPTPVPAEPPAPAAPAPRAQPVATPPTPVPPPVETLAIAALRLPAPDGVSGSTVLLPFGQAVGAAAFAHGPEAWVVFDDRRPLDLSALKDDPVFAGAVVELLPAATLLRIKLSSTGSMRLVRRADGWSVTASGPGAVGGAMLMPVSQPPRLFFPAQASSQVVVVPDSDTGQNLLVGTFKVAGPGVPTSLSVPEFAVRPSWQGLVVDPISDRTSLRVVPDGFALETGGPMSAVPADAADFANAAVLTRRFDFPAESTAALLRRMQAEMQQVAQAPAQARLEPRKRLAQTMLALGLGAEAQSLLQLAVAEDPRGADDPAMGGLSAIAALLGGRVGEAAGLDAPALSGTDEVALWRAVRAAMKGEGAPEAAPVFAATAGLLLVYPNVLRDRLLPLAAETMAEGGAPQAADALLAHLPNEPLLAFARAIRLEQKGDTAAALTAYDALAVGRDRLASARAATRATLLRLSSGAITPLTAAAALERGFGDWRGDTRESDLRLRTAEVEEQAGQWQKAVDTLKETAQLFPDIAATVDARIAALFGRLLHSPAANAIAPLDLVALAAENASAVAKADAASMAVLLAEKLTALDLPQRAAPIIEGMVAAAPPGAGRAALGARLAALRLGEGDTTGAAAALATTDAPTLPASLLEERGMIDARIHAQSHDTAGAAAILAALATPAADELRAKTLGDSGDWPGAAAALQSLVSRTVPPSGPLDAAQQDLLLRLASAESRAGDQPALRALGNRQGERVTGSRAGLFHLLTAAPVGGVSDLQRAKGDIALARALPSDLNAIGAH